MGIEPQLETKKMNKKQLILTAFSLSSIMAFSQHEHHQGKGMQDSTMTVNEHMHQKSTEDLIKHFESPERDAYQQPEKVLDYLGELKNKRIMDIGAGSGYFSRSEYFSKVKNGTKQNGELVIIDFFKTETPVGPPPDHKLSIDVVIAELKEAGYADFEVNVNLLPYQYIIRAK
jgi:hypothetical protein